MAGQKQPIKRKLLLDVPACAAPALTTYRTCKTTHAHTSLHAGKVVRAVNLPMDRSSKRSDDSSGLGSPVKEGMHLRHTCGLTQGLQVLLGVPATRLFCVIFRAHARLAELLLRVQGLRYGGGDEGLLVMAACRITGELPDWQMQAWLESMLQLRPISSHMRDTHVRPSSVQVAGYAGWSCGTTFRGGRPFGAE